MRKLLGFLTLACCAVGVAPAQSIYKCKGSGGAVAYSDQPCKNQPTQVIHQASSEEMADSALRQKADAMDDMLVSGRVDDARRYAQRNGMDALFNEHVNVLQQVRQRRATEQQAQLVATAVAQQQNAAAENARLRNQNAELADQAATAQDEAKHAKRQTRAAQANASAARQEANAAQVRANNAQIEQAVPKFDPQTGRYCQTTGGVLVCN
ncbi:DUF4124 domain-containing protein [Xanthomonas sp. NCPPB 2632]|uniref:DUF4124 domain-containing protein n=1 Tax=Xanthomonas sp. NCPPB 2632 TaxID=3240912 RepID=UPI0035198173